MNIIDELIRLLNEKKELFIQYEIYTGRLTECPVEDIEEYITQRGALANQIDKITDAIKCLCAGEKNGDALLAAINNTCKYDEVTQEGRALFSKGQEIFSVISRISEQEKQITPRMEELRTELLGKIKNASNTPKIAKYLSGLVTPPKNGDLIGEKYDKA